MIDNIEIVFLLFFIFVYKNVVIFFFCIGYDFVIKIDNFFIKNIGLNILNFLYLFFS